MSADYCIVFDEARETIDICRIGYESHPHGYRTDASRLLHGPGMQVAAAWAIWQGRGVVRIMGERNWVDTSGYRDITIDAVELYNSVAADGADLVLMVDPMTGDPT